MKIAAFVLAAAIATTSVYAGEIANTLGAVKKASPGDYIVLKDGSHYEVTAAEIAIVNGSFDYGSGEQEGVLREDGGMEYNITAAHKRVVWQDGKSVDIFTTTRAFDAYVKFIAQHYDVIPFTNYGEFVGNSYPAIVPPELTTFRGNVYHTFLTNGVDTYDYIDVKEYNRTSVGDGVERCYQTQGGDLCVTLSGGGNLSEIESADPSAAPTSE